MLLRFVGAKAGLGTITRRVQISKIYSLRLEQFDASAKITLHGAKLPAGEDPVKRLAQDALVKFLANTLAARALALSGEVGKGAPYQYTQGKKKPVDDPWSVKSEEFNYAFPLSLTREQIKGFGTIAPYLVDENSTLIIRIRGQVEISTK